MPTAISQAWTRKVDIEQDDNDATAILDTDPAVFRCFGMDLITGRYREPELYFSIWSGGGGETAGAGPVAVIY